MNCVPVSTAAGDTPVRREIEEYIGLAERLADCLTGIIGAEIFAIVHSHKYRGTLALLRFDLAFELAFRRSPETGQDMMLQPTFDRRIGAYPRPSAAKPGLFVDHVVATIPFVETAQTTSPTLFAVTVQIIAQVRSAVPQP